MSAIHEWATPGNLQPEPITEEIWPNLPEEFCRQVEVVNGQAIRCDSPGGAPSDGWPVWSAEGLI